MAKKESIIAIEAEAAYNAAEGSKTLEGTTALALQSIAASLILIERHLRPVVTSTRTDVVAMNLQAQAAAYDIKKSQ